MTINEVLKKKIIYRSNHRGSKEMDILLGNFVQKHIDNLNNNDLEDLSLFLLIEDEILSHFFFDKIENDIMRLLRMLLQINRTRK